MMENLLSSSLSARSCYTSRQIDGSGSRMNDAHHIHLDGAIKAELLGDSRHFIGSKHNAEAKEHMIRKSEQTEKQKRCLHT